MKMSDTRRLGWALLAGSVITRPSVAQTPVNGSAEAIHTVTHIDFMPSKIGAEAALDRYLATASHDPDVVYIELLQQMSAPNHFTLLETLKNQSAYNAHVEAPYTRRFRAEIHDALGSPYDERLFREYAAK